MRLRFTVTSRQAMAIMIGSALGCLALVGLGITQLSWPWFSVWLVLLLTFAVAAGSGWLERAAGLGRVTAWLLLLGGGALMNLHLYWIQLHRQRSERLDVTGVYLQPAGPFTVGAGASGLDVRLAGSLAEQDRWLMRVRREGQGFRIDGVEGVDWVDRRRGDAWTRLARLRGLAGGRSDWRPVWGEELGRDRRVASVRDPRGKSSRLLLRTGGPRGTIEWQGRRARLDVPGSAVLDRRLARALRRGATLDELAWDGPIPTGAERVAVTLIDAGVTTPLGYLRWPRYRVAARGNGYAVVPSAGVPGLAVAADDTLRVGSRGRVWAFALRSAPPMRWRSSDVVQVAFVQRPTSRGWALPAPDECESNGACALVSSHPLPPPIAHFDLSGFGLDTARYALLGRLDRLARTDSLRLVTDTSSRLIAFGEVQPVEARRLRADAPAAGFLLRVHRPEASDWASLAWTLFGLTLFLGLCGRAVRHSPLASRWLASTGPDATAAWLLVNVVTVLLSVRLLLGLRVTYAAPFYDRGAATAVGLWIATGALCVLLAWWPVLWRTVLRLARRRRDAGTQAARKSEPARRVVLGVLLPPAVAGVVVVATTLRLEDAMGVALVVALAVLAWLAVAVSEIAAAPERLGDHPLTMLTAETTAPDDLRATLAITAGLGLGVAVASRAPVASILAVVLLVLVTSAPRLVRRWRARRARSTALVVAGSSPTSLAAPGDTPVAPSLPMALRAVEVRAPVRRAIGWGAVLVLLVSVARLLDLLQGPTLLLGIIVMLFLLAVRAGVLSARRFGDSAGESGRGARGRLALLSALMLPIGALALAGLFDVGLALVVFVPLFVTVLLAASAAPMGRALALGAAVLFLVAAWGAGSVLFPSTAALERDARVDVARAAARFERMGGPVARLADLSEPTRVAVRRAIVRGLAARRPALLEQMLPAAGPSEARDEILPSLEQAWGGRAYAASGPTGAGFARTASFGRGISAATSYAENAFAVYVLSEHGAVGGIAVLAAYAALAAAVLWWALGFVRSHARGSAPAAALAVVAGGTMLLVLPAAYVALSNLGVVPLTGQNMPFLGLNAWSDVLFVAAIVSAMLSTLTSLAGSEAA